MEIASLASTRDDETITAGTLRLLDRILDWGKVHITLVTRLLHVFEELKEGQRMVSTPIDGATERRIEALMLVADVLSQVIFPKEGLLTIFGTATDECMLVFSRTTCPSWDSGSAWVEFLVIGRVSRTVADRAARVVVWSVQ
jgi:hypothetical protein